MSLVVHLQFSKFWAPNWRLGKAIIFVFEAVQAMGTCIKLFTTISLNFCQTFENFEQLRSYKFLEVSTKPGKGKP